MRDAIALQGLLAGLLVGLGVVLVLRRLPAFRQPTLDDRLAPYVADTRPHTVLGIDRTFTPFPTLERLLRPWLGSGAARLEKLLGGGNLIGRKLRQAGLDMTVQEFRVEQLIWGGVGFAIALVFSLWQVAVGTNPVLLLVVCAIAFGIGVVARDQYLSRQVKVRDARIIVEFPTVAEMLALAVGAGEGPVSALERVARVSNGELAKEIRSALADARAGSSLVHALEEMASLASLPVLARFVDGFAVAIERGTPLADVLRAQAQDVRDAGKRELVEAGGRKEISMMVPIVFLVMPVTVLFAVFPIASTINIGV
jgi:tight adherence protein C